MKKLLTVISAVFFMATLATAQKGRLEEQVVRTVENARNNPQVQAPVAEPSNAGMEKTSYVVDFEIQESVYDGDNDATYKADYRCKAYKLDEHWIILAGTCGNSVNSDIAEDGDHTYLKRHGFKFVQAYWAGRAVSPFVYKKNDHVMLLRTGDGFTLKAPYVKILATSAPQNLFSLTAGKDYDAVINTSRFGLNAARTRTLKPKTIQGDQFELRKGFLGLSGSATDPMFIRDTQGEVFIAAYNVASMRYYFKDHPFQVRGSTEPDGDYSNTWFSLTEDDLKFIKETVSAYPGDWERIKNRLFLNQTETPYEK